MGRVIKRKYKVLAAAVSGLLGLGAATPASGVDCNPEVGDCPPGGTTQGRQIELFTDSISPTEQRFHGQRVFDLGSVFVPPDPIQPPNPANALFEGKLLPPHPIRDQQSAFAEGKWYPPHPIHPGEYRFVGHFIDGYSQIPSGGVEDFLGHEISGGGTGGTGS